MKRRPVLLIILDGWGVSKGSSCNAISLANPVQINSLATEYPSTLLEASGKYVGLPDGLMGNSEVGHLNIGAGRIVAQDIVRISRAIQDGSFFKNEAFLEVFSFARKQNGKVHLLGLLSEGGVHSSFEHLVALIKLSAQLKFPALFVHPFLDGRDMPPQSALPLIDKLVASFKEFGVGEIATICGRYYAMDRDRRWERLEKAYRAFVLGEGLNAHTPREAIEKGYSRGETDEFILPTVIFFRGTPKAKIEDGDGAIFFNFRADRARQLTAALTSPDFCGFNASERNSPTVKSGMDSRQSENERTPQERLASGVAPAGSGSEARRSQLPQPKVSFVGMTQYDPTFKVTAAFAPDNLSNTLPEVWSKAGLTQFHAAETEKYAHVTYFFGGGREAPFPNEDRLLIPSPKVATYDLKPEMSAREVTQACLARIAEDKYDCIVMNFANADMVGHTGKLNATIQAVKVVDGCVGRLVEAILKKDGLIVITADHGNAEMLESVSSGQAHTAHTTSPVPLIFVDPSKRGEKLRDGGILADIAPTILETQGLPIPHEMTGRNLFLSKRASAQ